MSGSYSIELLINKDKPSLNDVQKLLKALKKFGFLISTNVIGMKNDTEINNIQDYNEFVELLSKGDTVFNCTLKNDPWAIYLDSRELLSSPNDFGPNMRYCRIYSHIYTGEVKKFGDSLYINVLIHLCKYIDLEIGAYYYTNFPEGLESYIRGDLKLLSCDNLNGLGAFYIKEKLISDIENIDKLSEMYQITKSKYAISGIKKSILEFERNK